MINKVYGILSTLNIPVQWQLRPKSFPSITFEIYNEYGQEYAEGEEIATGFNLQVDVWSKNDYSNLVKQVKQVLKESGFIRTNAIDLYEEDTQIYHKVLRFSYLEDIEESEEL